MIKQKLTLLILVFATFGNTKAQESFHRDSLLADFEYFIDALENTHPDPYTAFGGRVFFHEQAFEIENRLKSKDYTKEEFCAILSAFLAPLKDGHTGIRNNATKNKSNKLTLPIQFGNSGDELFITALPQKYKTLLGSRLVSINDIPAQKLYDKAAELYPTENYYGKTLIFRKKFTEFDYMKRMLPEVETQIQLQIKKVDGTTQNLSLRYLTPEEYKSTILAEVESWSKLPDEYMYYQFMDERKETMLFHFGSVMAKEAFINMKAGNFSGIGNTMKFYYKRLLKQEQPENEEEAIEKMPSLIELFHQMLVEMKENHSKTLIIDLRGNQGGFTPITLPTLYQLFGDKYLATDMGTKFIRRISPLYMEKRSTTLESFNKKNDSNFAFGDFTFEREKEEPSIEERRDNFIAKRSILSLRVKDFDGKPIYEPEKIIVITDDLTYSAAFHYAFYLWKMGATIVGVPCCQSPNTFMEATYYTLPKTKLKGRISNSLQLFLPPTDRRAKTFYPDHIMNWSDFKKYNFDKHAEVRYTMDLLQGINNKTLTENNESK